MQGFGGGCGAGKGIFGAYSDWQRVAYVHAEMGGGVCACLDGGWRMCMPR